MLRTVLLVIMLAILASGIARGGGTVAFTFKDLDGNEYSPATLKGNPVVILVGSTF